MTPGTIVRFRERDWVLLPSEEPELYRLRPLAGGEEIAVHRTLLQLLQYELQEETLSPSSFPLPSLEDLSDGAGADLLWQAARLTLKDGAAPLRSLGRISIRPRLYQLVPLLMALRIDPVRLFIADDVGVGKTIEALLIARELWDRREIRRLAVLCPPYLCDQWQKELREKFHLDAVVVRSSTVARLERAMPAGKTLYEHYPVQVLSIDWVKSDRNRPLFLQFCPELVIVDEVHGAAESPNPGQQQRHQLLRRIAEDRRRHLILLSATPHSGLASAFRSLLGLLDPKFRGWELGDLSREQRAELARHFVQRTRRDIEQDWEGEHCFPERQSCDESYDLSPDYRRLFEETYTFCSELVQGEGNRRLRYWGALALLRCVMSSPQAAAVALERRAGVELSFDEEGSDLRPFVFEAGEERVEDEDPTPPIERTEASLGERDRRRLRKLAQMAKALCHTEEDRKLARCREVIGDLLKEGFSPIIWCRYVATAQYVADHLERAFGDQAQVVCVTGRIGEEARREIIEELGTDRPRVLVATDCLSEGINLQEKFNAVLHYDLPWNPNRLEQREGRVDRYGQPEPKVRVIRFYGRDNPVDGAVLEVLLRKAEEIRRTLGTHVPVPEESEGVMEAIFNALFLRRRYGKQLDIFSDPTVQTFHRQWEEEAQRERRNRTRFAQRAIKPEEVRQELERVDRVLGDPEAVRNFVLNATGRLKIPFEPETAEKEVWRLDLGALPEPVRFSLPARETSNLWRISFHSPTPAGAEYVGRNHPFVTALAQFLLEEALSKGGEATAARCGVIRTSLVPTLTALLLLRARYLVTLPGLKEPMLAEEALVLGWRPFEEELDWLSEEEALELLVKAKPEENLPRSEKEELLREVLGALGGWELEGDRWGRENPLQGGLRERLLRRARELQESHRQIRKAIQTRVRELRVEPSLPPDLLGLLVLQPRIG